MRRSLDQAIATELKRRREEGGVRQDTVAYVAQKFGLSWTQSTVAAIERGRRSLSIGELGILPTIATEAGMSISRVVDLIPDTDEVVMIGPGLQIPLKAVRLLYGSHQDRKGPPPYRLKERYEYVTSEVERKASRALGVSPEAVLDAALALWGHPLATERDLRIGTRVRTLTPRSLQAVRGRVTRALVKDLKPRIRKRRR